MNIIQTIWNILITQNARLSNIMICPFVFIEAYLYMRIFTTFLGIESTRKQRLLYSALFAIISIINILFIPSPYYTFINVLACPVLVYFVFKLSISSSILSEIIMYFTSVVVATPLVLIYTLIFGVPSALVASVPIHRLVYSMCFYALLYLFYKIAKKHSFKLSSLKKLKSKFSPIIWVNFIIGTLAIAVQCYVEFLYTDYIPSYLILISLSVLVAYFVSSLTSLFRTTKLEVTTEKLEEEKLYNETLTLLYDNIRGFKHDFNNIVQGIGGYISTDNMEGLKEYYSEVLDDCQRVNNLALLSPEVINNPAIYSLLTSKYHTAMEYGIKMNLEIFMDLSTIHMKIYELTKILGILIDNAIEASKQCEDKVITITIRKDNRANKQLFIVENTYMNKDVNIDEIFEKGNTSKACKDPKCHGLGLWEIRQILKKNKNLNLHTTKNEKYFKQQFEIYC